MRTSISAGFLGLLVLSMVYLFARSRHIFRRICGEPKVPAYALQTFLGPPSQIEKTIAGLFHAVLCENLFQALHQNSSSLHMMLTACSLQSKAFEWHTSMVQVSKSVEGKPKRVTQCLTQFVHPRMT